MNEYQDEFTINNYEELKKHVGHKIFIESHGDKDVPSSIELVCDDCGEILVSYKIPKTPICFIEPEERGNRETLDLNDGWRN